MGTIYKLANPGGDTVAVPRLVFSHLTRVDGDTLRVALYVLDKNCTDPRTIARDLGLKSIEAANRALQYWSGAGLLEPDRGAPAAAVPEHPVQDKTHMQFDRVGSHIANYDFLINLAHFKGHAMGGFGGVLKNQSIGMASREGKTLIHTAGEYSNPGQVFNNHRGQDAFLESMAAAAQAVHNYFGGKVIYINVMNNLSVDCDCDGNPSAPQMHDIGILASLDPVALDKACLDLVFNHQSVAGDDSEPLIQRINRQHGTHIVDYAEQIGLGTTSYNLIDIDESTGISQTAVENTLQRYNVFTVDGIKLLTNAKSLDSLTPGVYIVNGRKTTIM